MSGVDGAEALYAVQNQQTALLSPEKVMANLASINSKTMRAFLAYSGRLDMETLRQVNAGNIKFRDAAWIHRARIRGGTSGGTISVLRSNNTRRPGISDFYVNKLPKGLNICVGGISVRYGKNQDATINRQTLDDETVENVLAAVVPYTNQAYMPAFGPTTYNFQGSFDTNDTELVTRIPTILQSSILTIKQAGIVEHQMTLGEMLLASWNAPPEIKRGGAYQLEKAFMLWEDKDISIDLTFPQSGDILPITETLYHTHPGQPVSPVTYNTEHFLEITFHGVEGAPIR